MKRVLFGLFLALTVSAAAQTKDDTFVFMPQWYAQAQFAGYYVAQEKGFYAEEGIQVDIVHPLTTQSVQSQIIESHVDAVSLPIAQALEMIGNGHPLVNLLQTSMNSAMMFISRNGGDPFQIPKAKVTSWLAGYDQLARCIASKEHWNCEWVKSASSVNLFIAGAVDVTLAMSFNEYYQLRQAGLIGSGNGVYRFSDHGYNIQQDGVYMSRRAYSKKANTAQAFARASRRGWEWAAAHPDETLDIVMQYVKRYRIPTNRILQRLMLEETLRLQLDPDSGDRSFRLRKDMVEKADRMMMDAGILKREVRYEELLP